MEKKQEEKINFEELKSCKTKQDFISFLSKNCTKNKYVESYKKKIANAKSTQEVQQIAWDCCLQSEGKYFLGKEVTRNSWFKGTSIGGMECHSYGH